MSLLSITSRHHQHRSHNTLSMHKSEIVSRQVPAPAQQYLSHFDSGTRVSVRNLFGNMPVRVKQRAIISEKQGPSKEWECLKRDVVLLLLAWPTHVVMNLRELTTNQKMIIRGSSRVGARTDTPRVCSILSQSMFIAPEEKVSWIAVGASTSNLNVSGAISLDPSPTKHIQFISFDIQPLLAHEGQSILHDGINRLFLNSAFGNDEEAEDLDDAERSRRAKDARYKGNGYTNRELKGGKKGVDRWPMFYINIQRMASSAVTEIFDVDDILDDKANSLSAIIELLQVMVLEFLTRHHFRPKTSRGQRSRHAIDAPDETPTEDNTLPQRDHKIATFVKPPSAKAATPKPSILEKKKGTKIRTTNSDLLGTNVKLPSFHQSSTTMDSPFDAWSRIKSGTVKPALHKTSELSQGHEIERPSTAPPLSLSPVIKINPPPPSTPLISPTGKVTRRPFEDMHTDSTQSKSTPLRPLPAHSSQLKAHATQPPSTPIDLTADNDDDIIAWINPITKAKSIVNKRTGHTVPAPNSSTPASLRSSSSPNLSSRPKLHSSPSAWLSNILEKWDNPIFRPTEPSVPQLSLGKETQLICQGHRHNCSLPDIDRAFTVAPSGIQGPISRQALRNAEVIGQVDRKFILAKLSSVEIETRPKGKMLVIIDQHAADERIRVENLLAELCTPQVVPTDGMPSESTIATTYLEKGLMFEVSEKDIELLRTKRGYFATWGICYDLPPATKSLTDTPPRKDKGKQKFSVRSLPPGIVERCKSDSKLLIELIRTELYTNTKTSSHAAYTIRSTKPTSEADGKAWLSRIHTCPQGILDMLNSRACRSAIMFNDVLSKEQCQVLTRMLADTAFPFQCAHGRPSLLPLVGLGSVQQGLPSLGFDERAEEGGFGRAFGRLKSEVR